MNRQLMQTVKNFKNFETFILVRHRCQQKKTYIYIYI